MEGRRTPHPTITVTSTPGKFAEEVKFALLQGPTVQVLMVCEGCGLERMTSHDAALEVAKRFDLHRCKQKSE